MSLCWCHSVDVTPLMSLCSCHSNDEKICDWATFAFQGMTDASKNMTKTTQPFLPGTSTWSLKTYNITTAGSANNRVVWYRGDKFESVVGRIKMSKSGSKSNLTPKSCYFWDGYDIMHLRVNINSKCQRISKNCGLIYAKEWFKISKYLVLCTNRNVFQKER